jgi:phospholipase/carboxylesterase
MMPAATRSAGAPLVGARAVVIMLHGRGGTADHILTLADLFAQSDLAYLAPQAVGGSWYPYSFLAPLERNEPALSTALATVGESLAALASRGFSAERIFLLGFSQGGCLALEYAARHARRYAGVVGLSAGLIGPEQTPRTGVASRFAHLSRLRGSRRSYTPCPRPRINARPHRFGSRRCRAYLCRHGAYDQR